MARTAARPRRIAHAGKNDSEIARQQDTGADRTHSANGLDSPLGRETPDAPRFLNSGSQVWRKGSRTYGRMSPRRRHQSRYSTALQVAVQRGQAPLAVVRRIPRSTRLGMRQRLDYWMRYQKRCAQSLADLCRVRHPFQLVGGEIRKIREWLTREEYRSWPLVSVFLHMREQSALFCGLSTFYKYTRLLGFTRRRKRWRKPPRRGIRAAAPGELLHADVTHVWLYGGQKVAILHVIDNFSRKLLASVAMDSASAEQCLAVLVQVIQENAGVLQNPFTLLTDDGSENKGVFDQWALAFPDLVRKLIAMKHITFSNSMAEVAHHIIKGDYIRDHVFHTIEALQAFLDRSRADYNARPAAVHDGLSANAVFAGARPVLGRFQEDTRAARAARVSENQKIDCSACAVTSQPA